MNETKSMLGFVVLTLGLALGCKIKSGGVVEPELKIVNEQRGPGEGPGPDVLIVTFDDEQDLSGGYLAVRVQQLSVELRRTNCVKGCADYRDRFGKEYAVNEHQICTGAFVSHDTIATASHCLFGSNWKSTYGVIGYYADAGWPIEAGKMRVPVSHVVRFCHAQACEKVRTPSPDPRVVEGTDFALVHVCPVVPTGFVEHGSLALAPADTEIPAAFVVRSHALGAPLKRYDGALLPGSPSFGRFTNFPGGSGSAVVNSAGELVGVVRGFVDETRYANCPDGSDVCAGQHVAWIKDIHRIIDNKLTCANGRWEFPVNHIEQCSDLQGTSSINNQE